MILPIGDAPNPKGFAPVTWALVALNVAVFLFVNLPLGNRRADPRDPSLLPYLELVSQDRPPLEVARQTSALDLVLFRYGYRPAEPSLVALLTSLFLHGGLGHLFGNMLFLWIYGDNVERRLGPWLFLVAYLATGVVATLSHAVFASSSPMPLVGASGAISGILGFYFVWFPRNRVRLLFFLPPFFFHVFEVGARVVLGFYVVIDNLLPLLLVRSGGGVAHGAHLGGFVAGFLWVSACEWRARCGRPTSLVEEEQEEQGDVPKLVAEGRLGEAARAYFALPEPATRKLLTSDLALELARGLREAGHADAALVVLRRQVRDTQGGPDLGEIYALAGLILLDDEGSPAAAWQYLLTALDLGLPPEAETSVRQALARIEALQKRQVGHLHRSREW